MSTTDQTPVEPVDTIEPEAEAPETESGADEPQGDEHGVREAQRYRKRAQEAEAQRDALVAQLDAARRTIVEAGLRKTPAAAFWALHPDVDDLLDESGNVDPAKVAEAAQAVHVAIGQPGGSWKGARGPLIPNAGQQPDMGLGAGSFEAAFGPRSD